MKSTAMCTDNILLRSNYIYLTEAENITIIMNHVSMSLHNVRIIIIDDCVR